eukprot:CAMPEP_0177623828 /NCGR_PEP_ID=MMETSP0419_2-20121207/29127_1 /TAXON_ID=582737 /ORGANISM="Tetraselmis sp., Strain GSL018" /LENGTH=63 /DNA_ID=CAMNT_0019124439 /DNA_START=62 /DNA_END=250 /DNA_ORIENTATION=-
MDIDTLRSELDTEKELRAKAEAEVLRLEADIVFTRKDGEANVKEIEKLKREVCSEKETVSALQ